VKAIELATNPGNFTVHGKTADMKVAFGIGLVNARCFAPILYNLQIVGLSTTDVYV